MTQAQYSLPRSHRLSGRSAFGSVFAARTSRTVGPLRVHGMPNGLAHLRLGLSVSRRVGGAVKRNRVKRLLREAFRLCQHDWPAGYDLVVVVLPHEAVTLADYQRMLFAAIRGLHQVWTKRSST